MASQKSSWVSLPQEIRLIILEELVGHEGCLTGYSTVCREWQQIVERKNFSRLKLTVSRIPKFSGIVCQRRRLVKYIWLYIELQEYDCSMCDRIEANEWYEINTTIITRAMTQLFSVLSSWESTGNLSLDISIHSPSDSRHRYKKLYFSSDAFSEPDDQQEATNPHDPRHGWVEGELVSRPPIPSLERLFEDIEMAESSFWEELPKVEAVTSLLLRRQTRRRWAASALYELLDHLPRLQEIYYEPWREWCSMDQRLTDEDTEWLFESIIPNQIRRMVLFEDFNDDYIALSQRLDRVLDVEPFREAGFAMSREIAEASLNLEHLSASFIVDARHFFQARQSTWVWNKLVSLTLTSRTLSPDKDLEEMNDALQAAAVTAVKMPMLNTMELWNYQRGSACVFRYQVKDRGPTITWRGDWDLLLEPRVIQSWQSAALEPAASLELRVVKELLDVNVHMKSHGDAIHHLGLVQEVVHPVSLWQIQKETTNL